MTAQPEFATNRPGETVADAVNGLLKGRIDSGQAPPIAIASAYFNLAGFGLLADNLEKVGQVRLLLGAQPTDFVLRSTVTPGYVLDAATDPRVSESVSAHERALREDRDLIEFRPTADNEVTRLIDWLRSGQVKVRRMTQGFLHGKAIHRRGGSQPSDDRRVLKLHPCRFGRQPRTQPGYVCARRQSAGSWMVRRAMG